MSMRLNTIICQLVSGRVATDSNFACPFGAISITFHMATCMTCISFAKLQKVLPVRICFERVGDNSNQALFCNFNNINVRVQSSEDSQDSEDGSDKEEDLWDPQYATPYVGKRRKRSLSSSGPTLNSSKQVGHPTSFLKSLHMVSV